MSGGYNDDIETQCLADLGPLLESLVVPAVLRDAEGRIVDVNFAAERASGHSPAAVRGKAHEDGAPCEACRQRERFFQRAAHTGEPAEFETEFVDGAGRLRVSRLLYLPLLREGAFDGVLALVFDPSAFGGNRLVLPQLTARQVEILQLVAAGSSPAQIAAKLMLSTATVRNHLRQIYRELEVHTLLEAVAAARSNGLLATAALGAGLHHRPPCSS